MMAGAEERLTTSDLTGRTEEDETLRASEDDERGMGRGAGEEDERAEPLLPQGEGDAYHTRWQEIQVRFVDDPRASVSEADALVAELMQRLAETFSDERTRLEGEWERGEEVSTEDLRQALRHYRSFFQRLLST